MRWYHRVISAPEGDFTALAEALVWFETEHEKAQGELKLSGRIEAAAARLPGNAEYYYGIAMEIEHILKWLEIQIERTVAKWRRHYLEHYNRQMNMRDAEKYAESEKEVFDLRLLTNHVALVRNKFHGITKGLEYMHFQIGNIVALRKVGIEDASI